MKYVCPVCNYDGLDQKPYNDRGYGSYEICLCCGFQFGVDDFPDKEQGIREWRERWIENGCRWTYGQHLKPPNWDPVEQLNRE